jgi:hypothetical protein
MKLTKLAYATFTAVALVAAAPAPAFAIFDTYISATGSDANPCTITNPCATFGGALSATQISGVIHCLDSRDYTDGIVTITKSVTIDCSNTTASGGPFVINGTGIEVQFIGLTMLQYNVPAIDFQRGAALYVEKCKFFGDIADGVKFEPSTAAQLVVSDSVFTQSCCGVVGAIYIKPASGITVQVSINNSRIANNSFGIIADGTNGGIIQGTISDSVISDNTENGITASTTSSNVLLLVDQTKVSGNLHGLVAGGSSAAIMARNTTVTGNTAAGLFTVNGGQLFSYGNNSVDGNNGNNGAFTGPATLK